MLGGKTVSKWNKKITVGCNSCIKMTKRISEQNVYKRKSLPNVPFIGSLSWADEICSTLTWILELRSP